MKNKIILHIDMNSYFASVEQQANPFLRGKAVGVCAYLSPGGCIIASSVEAKAKGIKTGCTVREAMALDPNVFLIENEPAKYRSTTEKIFGILSSYTDRLEPYSIDEAFLDLTGWVKDFDAAEKLAVEIRSRIKEEVGEWLKCSIGISWTKFLSKFAGDLAPKNGCLAIKNEEELVGILKGRTLVDAWGINNRMAARLYMIGINDLLELKDFSPSHIRRLLGRYGYYLWANVNGLEITEVNNGTPQPKSVGHSYCLPKKTTDKEYLSSILYKLCEKTGRRLRAMDMEARVIHAGWSYIREGGPDRQSFSGGGAHKSFTTPDKMYTTDEIFRQANDFLESSYLIMPVRMLFVSVSKLTPLSNQMSLFEDNLGKKNLSISLDRINDKYGEYTITNGRMFDLKDVARDRVGFRKSVEV